MWCDVMWCDVMWCDVMWCDVMWCDVMWCDVMWCDVMWCDVVWCSVMWCDDVTRRSIGVLVLSFISNKAVKTSLASPGQARPASLLTFSCLVTALSSQVSALSCWLWSRHGWIFSHDSCCPEEFQSMEIREIFFISKIAKTRFEIWWISLWSWRSSRTSMGNTGSWLCIDIARR